MLGYFLMAIVLFVVAGHIYKSRYGYLPEWKYFKPFSMSWWVSMVPALVGMVILGEPVGGWTELADAARLAAQGQDPSQLVIYSAGLIGLVDRITPTGRNP